MLRVQIIDLVVFVVRSLILLFQLSLVRYSNQEKYAEAIDLLYDGAMKLSQHGQHQRAADLCMLLVETLKKSDDGEIRATI